MALNFNCQIIAQNGGTAVRASDKHDIAVNFCIAIHYYSRTGLEILSTY